MKTAKVTHFIIMGMLAAAIVVAVIAYSVAWFQMDVATPYTFDIHANGVLYVYMDSEVVDNAQPLVPAVAIPGAISEGLPYNVLTTYNAGDANPSYIQKAASITNVQGEFIVNNEGYAYDKFELPKDSSGYTLYPAISAAGKIIWVDDSDHSKGWVQQRKPTKFTETEDPVAIEWSQETDYEPKLDANGYVVWNSEWHDSLDPGNLSDIYTNPQFRGQQFWMCREELREGSSECTVHLNIRFKASEDSEVDDYFDNSNFVIHELYITRTLDNGTEVVPFTEHSADYTTCSYTMYGIEHFVMHAKVYLAQPDELLDPALRGGEVYMTIAVSVEVRQFGE